MSFVELYCCCSCYVFSQLFAHFFLIQGVKCYAILGCFLVLRKLLFVSFCVVVWVLFSVFSIFCITSLVSATPRNHPILHSLPKQFNLVPRTSWLTVQFSGNYALNRRHFSHTAKFFQVWSTVALSWLWWIMHGILADQKWRIIWNKYNNGS